MTRRTETATALLVLLFAACGCGSSTAPSPAGPPDFHGQFTGSYIINRCTEAGVFFNGFCVGLSFVGGTFPLQLSLVQNQASVSGTIVLSRAGGTPISGSFEGSIDTSGHLMGRATLQPLTLLGTITREITAWDTTIATGTLNGGFTLVHRSAAEPGSMTVTATLAQMTRQ